ncbi:MAG: BlaI/MecI/CopY family transcriptional regulator [Acidobacteriia bacterium]|nr:BlaI/MecI/CopY family transcriptional regulator [Terriglobia bacterium]
MDCLRVLWSRPEASVAEVRAGLPRPLAYTTVMTVLDRMCGKGLVKRRKRGRAWSYSACLDLDTARAEAVRRLVANLFESDNRALVRYLLGEGARPRRRVTAASSIDDELL